MASLHRLDLPPMARPPAPVRPGHLSLEYLNCFFGKERTEVLLARAMPEDSESAGAGVIDHFTFWRMCIDNVLCSNDETHGIAAVPLPRATWGMVFSAVNQMEDVGEGLKRFAQLVSVLRVGITVTLSYSARGTHVRYHMTNTGVTGARLDRYLESLALFFHCMLVSMADQAFQPIELRLSGRLRDEDGSLWSTIGCRKERRGSGLTVIYDRQAVVLPLGMKKYQCWCTQGTEALFRILGTAAIPIERDSRLSAAIRRLLSTELLSLDEAAANLALSAATLRRRLAAEGTSFRELCRQVRKARLISLLETDSNLDDVAVEVGLSDRRALSRMCNDLLGMSPSSYRAIRDRPSVNSS